MSHGHGVDNCCLRFCRKGRQWKLEESRSLTQSFRWNLQPVLGVSVRIRSRPDGDDGDGNGDGGDGDGDGTGST
jgi:hypothetical protein